MEITKEKGQLVIRVPLKKRRFNPYNDCFTGNGDVGEMDNVIAVYESDTCNGLTYAIDMGYKGKDDQFTDYFLRTDMGIKDFEKLVKELELSIVYYFPLRCCRSNQE